MSFQKCPVCEGTGQVQRFGVNPVCHVCNGHGIIDEVTGQPPVSSVTISNSEDVYISKSPTVAPPDFKPYTTSKTDPISHPTVTSKANGRTYQVISPEIIAEVDKEIKKKLKDLNKKSK